MQRWLAFFVTVLACTSSPTPPPPEAGPEADVLTCAPPTMKCGTACLDTTSDPQNCGGCGIKCPGTTQCEKNVCLTCDKIDADKDGYNACTDCNDSDPAVNQDAAELLGNAKDDDCDGKVDNDAVCDDSIANDSSDAMDYAHAMELCGKSLQNAQFVQIANPNQRQVANDWGIFTPQHGKAFAAFSTGIAATPSHTKPLFDVLKTPQSGTDFGASGTNYPLPIGSLSCSDADAGPQTVNDPATVRDYVELSLVLKVPSNAHGFAVDLQFLTADAPEWLCSIYEDQALVLLDSPTLKDDILRDSTGRKMRASNALLTLNTALALKDTGMDGLDSASRLIGGGTGWLTMVAPATPGETMKLRIILFDVEDGEWDSQALYDNFRWIGTKVCAPVTVPAGPTPPDGCTDGG